VAQNDKKTVTSTRDALIQSLNEDLAREYQAIIAYAVYSQVLRGCGVHEYRPGTLEARRAGTAGCIDYR
jgi:bacterioferritin (cytochrome b1)